MKVAIVTVQVPFTRGGAETHAASLRDELVKRGHEADVISIPFKWYPPERLLDCMLMARLMDVGEVNGLKIDRVIALKFPAYYAEHPNKVGWILHQHRQAYELYGTPYCDLHQTEEGQRVAREIRRWDDKLFGGFRRLFANSRTVADRLGRYNRVEAEPLYHPPGGHEKFRRGDFDPYVLYPGRFDSLKRQHLIVEAMKAAPRGLKLVLIGPHEGAYGDRVLAQIEELGLSGRVEVRGPVSEETKLDLYANCLAVYNGVYEEDYGYVTLEAFLSGKPVITHPDSGGPLEFVEHEVNGFIVPPEPGPVADCLGRLAGDTRLAWEMGARGREVISARNICWDHVIGRLTA